MCGLAVVGCPAIAEARDVVYSAPEGCPSKSDVAARIEARAPSDRSTRIDVTKTKDGFHGDLVVGDTTRSVDARTCGGVVEALALVVSLQAPAQEEAQYEEGAVAEPEAPPPSTAPPALDTDPDRDRPLAPAPRTTRWAIGNTMWLGGFADGATVQGLAFFVQAAGKKPLLDVPVFEPSIRLRLGFTLPKSVASTTVTPRDQNGVYCPSCGPVMTLVVHDIDLCPLGVGHHGSVSASICGRTEVGVLVADNAGTTADAQARFWAAMGPVGRFRVLLNNAVARAFFEVEGGALGALRRDRFHFTGYDTVVPRAWAWMAGGSVGVVLP